jgi:D-serine dehydratase
MTSTVSRLKNRRLLAALQARQPLLWANPRRLAAGPVLAYIAERHALAGDDIVAADRLLRNWAPALQLLFPELAAGDGLIESALYELADAASVTGAAVPGRALIKADHALPVAGSIKARGGIYEVLSHAQDLAQRGGLLAWNEDPRALLEAPARALFGRHTICVGSTGNLGLSIGIMAAALGFHAVVHMSHDAKPWKKGRLRERGVTVVEHAGDYASAVAAGRQEALAAPRAHFVDDENSRKLFLGYSVAALRLQAQLAAREIRIDEEHPLIVYLPCGVGGAPGGITFGLKHVFGDAAHCYFAEPCASPAMLLRLVSEDGPMSVYDIGLDNRTEADGLAVAQASELVYELVAPLVSGVYTVADDDLFRVLARLQRCNGDVIEPSAAAAFLGVQHLSGVAQGPLHAALHAEKATHLFWTTGGAFLPAEEFQCFYRRGTSLLAAAPPGPA